MKIFKRLLFCFICSTILLIPILAGCNINLNKNASEPNNDYQLITTLNKYKISNYYGNSVIHTTNSGAVTMILEDNEVGSGFVWDLSNQSLNAFTGYAVKFNNLKFSGFSAVTDYTLSLRLKWQDSTYTYLRYYDTQTKLFGFTISEDSHYLYLDALEYNTYEVMFKFNHSGVKNADNKNLYFDFTGIEKGGTVSFDSLSLYEIKETTSTPPTTPSSTTDNQWGTTEIVTVISLIVFALILLISLIAAICKIVSLKKQLKKINCGYEAIDDKLDIQAERTKEE